MASVLCLPTLDDDLIHTFTHVQRYHPNACSACSIPFFFFFLLSWNESPEQTLGLFSRLESRVFVGVSCFEQGWEGCFNEHRSINQLNKLELTPLQLLVFTHPQGSYCLRGKIYFVWLLCEIGSKSETNRLKVLPSLPSPPLA